MVQAQTRKNGVGLLAIWMALVLFFAATNPNRLSAMLIMAPIIWMFVCLWATIYVLLPYVIARYRDGLRLKRATFAGVAALLPTSLLLLQSINQLTVKDILLISLLAGLTFSYLRRFRFSQKID